MSTLLIVNVPTGDSSLWARPLALASPRWGFSFLSCGIIWLLIFLPSHIENCYFGRRTNVRSFVLWVALWETVTHSTLVVHSVKVLFCRGDSNQVWFSVWNYRRRLSWLQFFISLIAESPTFAWVANENQSKPFQSAQQRSINLLLFWVYQARSWRRFQK